MLTSVLAACTEQRSSATLRRGVTWWGPAAVAAVSLVAPRGAPVGILAIPLALLAAAALTGGAARLAISTSTLALVAAPLAATVRGNDGPRWIDAASTLSRIALMVGLAWIVATLLRQLRGARDAGERVSQDLHLHLYAGYYDPAGEYTETYTGPGVEHILGRPLRPGERNEDAWEAAVHAGDRSAYIEWFSAEHLSGRETTELEYRLVSADGSLRWLLERVRTALEPDGTVRLSGVAIDVTELRREADELRDARLRMDRLVEAVDDVLFELELTPSGDLVARHVHAGIARLLGGAPDKDVLACWRDAVHPDDRSRWREQLAQMRAGEASAVEYRLVGQDTVVRTVWSRVVPHRDPAGGLLLIGVLADVSRRVQMELELEAALAESQRQAQTDALTGLANRARLGAVLDARLERPDTADCTGVLLLDVDRFKRINDTHGHQTGDEVLVELSNRLVRRTGERGLVARLGGEELAVLVSGVRNEPGLRDLAEELRDEIASMPVITRDGTRVAVTVSIGAAQGGASFPTRDSLLSAADRALYAAKRRGRNRVLLVGDLTPDDLADQVPEAVRIAQSMALLAGTREGTSPDHAKEVARMSELTAVELGLDPAVVRRCLLGGWLHDIGKASIPDRILTKTGPLDVAEWETMRRHVELGQDIINQVDEIATAASAVRHHHEHVDGTGYPDGLAGDAIPIEARVVAAADAYVSIAGDRSHAAALGADAALDVLRAAAGTHLDADVVAALARVIVRDRAPAERRAGVRHRRAA